MSEDVIIFEAAADAEGDETLVVDLDGFEGPLDVLLDLARQQKVDLAHIALAPLVDQYIAFVDRAKARIDLAAEYLVMASWLTLLKSRLLLPKPDRPCEEPDADVIAAHLTLKLQRLAEAKAAAAKLGALAQLDRDVFLNGLPSPVAISKELQWTASLHDILAAYTSGRARRIRVDHRIELRRVYSLEAARQRLEHLIEEMDDWRPIGALQPRREKGPDAPEPASYVSSLFGAALELVRDQRLEARQADQHAPLYLRRRPAP